MYCSKYQQSFLWFCTEPLCTIPVLVAFLGLRERERETKNDCTSLRLAQLAELLSKYISENSSL